MKQNLVAVITGGAKASTKVLLSIFLALPFLMQVDAFKNFVTPILAQHPRIASVFGSMVAIALLLHNPQVQKALGFDLTAESKPDGTSTATATLVEVDSKKS